MSYICYNCIFPLCFSYLTAGHIFPVKYVVLLVSVSYIVSNKSQVLFSIELFCNILFHLFHMFNKLRTEQPILLLPTTPLSIFPLLPWHHSSPPATALVWQPVLVSTPGYNNYNYCMNTNSKLMEAFKNKALKCETETISFPPIQTKVVDINKVKGF